jgi:hypothetical protein
MPMLMEGSRMSDQDLKSYLEKEIADGKKAVIASLALFILVAILTVSYFQWFKAEVEPFLEPDELAEFTVSEARRNLPAVVDNAGKALIAALPAMIRDAMDGVMETTLPMLRKESTGWMRAESRKIAGVGSAAVSTAFEQIIIEKRGELKAVADSEPGQFIPGVRLDSLSRFVEMEAAKKYNSVPDETLGQKLDKGASALRNINTSLKELAAGNDLTRKDALGKRFISVWWTMLKQLDDGEAAAEKMMGLKAKPREQLQGESD